MGDYQDLLSQAGRSQSLSNGFHSESSPSSQAELDASNIKITLTKQPRSVPAPGSAEEKSQKVCTDHMVSAQWTLEKGWAQPEITPYGPLAIMPTANVLHYATECFEGMKLYRGLDGKLRLFRPYANCLRMLTSAQRISLPGFEPTALLGMIKKLCALDGPKWLPQDRRGSFLYIRPAMIGTDSCLGFEVPKEALLFAVISYWPQPAKPTKGKGLRLFASREDELRSWPGGTGFAKIGPNYGPALLAHGVAKKMGYDQVLWLYGPDCQLTEAGSSNVFLIRRSQDGHLQMITAPLDEKTILAGVTRQSVLDLAREKFAKDQDVVVEDATGPQHVAAVEVIERNYTMSELLADLEKGNLLSVFVVGTAAFVTAVSQIDFRGQNIQLETDATYHTELLRQWMYDIMYGKVSSGWADIIEEEG
ncbi:branched-chain amino acid aminotransferase [Fonsecaea pedrosoi CBS 271.37]|uniref:Branched-chain-amino-acid aminotransferase n=1 Tax=Fonsecaea pedrosoi CBS 271.37 TaxID=1442368 RepID=A0A0D2GL86_9EURO|nr:branched-chain amino acid aminotransferase [Fonsecaea pedrosoi CBS 271.37]KIW79285.1 branched-chain amino acid aminotransferase [Fonsecaea pedrosoi CBS 271.37]